MKITLIAIAISAAALFGFTSTAEAGGGSKRYSGSTSQSRYLVSTREIKRSRSRQVRYDHGGRSHRYYVTVVTYRATYSDGTSWTYTRTFT